MESVSEFQDAVNVMCETASDEDLRKTIAHLVVGHYLAVKMLERHQTALENMKGDGR